MWKRTAQDFLCSRRIYVVGVAERILARIQLCENLDIVVVANTADCFPSRLVRYSEAVSSECAAMRCLQGGWCCGRERFG